MKKQQIVGFLCSLLLVGFSSVASANDNTHANTVELDYRYWKPQINATAGPAIVGGITVDSVDVRDKLGLQDKGFGEYQLRYHLNDKSALKFSYFDAGFSGTATPNIIWGGMNLTGGEFHTTVDFKNTEITWEKYITNDSDTKQALTFGLRNVKIEAYSARTDGSGISFNKDFNILFPTLGVTYAGGLESPISTFGGLSVSYAGSRGHFLDAELGAKAFLNEERTTSFTAGYRYYKIKGEKSGGDKFDATLKGPFFEAAFRF